MAAKQEELQMEEGGSGEDPGGGDAFDQQHQQQQEQQQPPDQQHAAAPSVIVDEVNETEEVAGAMSHLEVLRREKAQIEQQNFNLTTELDDVKEKFIVMSAKNSELSSEVEGLARELNERQRLYRILESARDQMQIKKAEADELAAKLRREREDKDIAVRKANKDKQILAGQNSSLREQIKQIGVEKAVLAVEKRNLEHEKRQAAVELERARTERQLFDGNKKWMMNEIAERDNTIAQLRIEMGAREITWTNERSRLADERARAEAGEEELRIQMNNLEQQLKEMTRRLAGIAEENDDRVQALNTELRNKESVIAIVKDNLEKAEMSAQNMQSMYQESTAMLEEAKQAVLAARTEANESCNQANEKVIELEKKVGELKDELEKANELIKNKHNLSLMTDEALEELSPAAAAASRLLKSAGSLSAIYREYARLCGELAEAKQKATFAEQAFNEIFEDINDRAPQLLYQREQLEKVSGEKERLENALEVADKQRAQLMEQRDAAARELAFTKIELERYQRDHAQLSQQISHLIFVLEKERTARLSGRDSPADSEDEDRALFGNIRQLQARNMQLENELAAERAKAAMAIQNAHNAELDILRGQLESVKEELNASLHSSKTLKTVLEKVEEQRDSYRRLVETNGIDADAASARRRAEQTAHELKKEQEKGARLEEFLNMHKAEKDRVVRVYEERVEQQMTVLSEVKRTNARLECDLELEKQTAVKNHDELVKAIRELERCGQSEEKEKNRAIALEAKIADVQMQLVNMQGELSQAKVQCRSLSEDLHRVRGEEQRLNAQLRSLEEMMQQKEQLNATMLELNTRLQRLESEGKAAVESRAESLEAERDQLKRALADADERAQRLASTHAEQVARLTAERQQLGTWLEQERAQRESGEKLTQELRAKLAAAQAQYSVDTAAGIGATPERLQKECQQLQNHSKYLQSQLEEQKKRAEAAELAASKAIEEASRLAGLSGTLESSLVEQNNVMNMEKDRLQAMLESARTCAKESEEAVERLRLELASVEQAKAEIDREFAEHRLQHALTVATLEEQLASEQSRANQAAEAARLAEEREAAIASKLQQLESDAAAVQQSLDEVRTEREQLDGKLIAKEADFGALEEELKKKDEAWAAESERQQAKIHELEAAVQSMRVEIANQQAIRDDLNERINGFAQQLAQQETATSMALAAGAASADSSINTASSVADGDTTIRSLAAVNQYLREEKCKANERCMAAEVEQRRLRYELDEKEHERARFEEEMKKMQRQAEADAAALSERAQLAERLEQMTSLQQENQRLKMDREKMQRANQEAQRMRTEHLALETQLKGQLSTVNNDLQKLNQEMEQRKARVEQLQRDVAARDAELQRTRSEMAATRQQTETNLRAQLTRTQAERDAMKQEKEAMAAKLQADLAKATQELEAANGKNSQLKTLALQYKKKFEEAKKAPPAGAAGTTGEDIVKQEAENATAAASTSSTGADFATPPRTAALIQLQAENEDMRKQLTAALKDAEEARAHYAEMEQRQNAITSMASREKQRLLDRISQLEREAASFATSSAPSTASSAAAPQTIASILASVGGGGVSREQVVTTPLAAAAAETPTPRTPSAITPASSIHPAQQSSFAPSMTSSPLRTILRPAAPSSTSQMPATESLATAFSFATSSSAQAAPPSVAATSEADMAPSSAVNIDQAPAASSEVAISSAAAPSSTTSTTSSLLSHPPLFGRSAPPPKPADISASSTSEAVEARAIPDAEERLLVVQEEDEEEEVEEEDEEVDDGGEESRDTQRQPISSSSHGGIGAGARKRPAVVGSAAEGSAENVKRIRQAIEGDDEAISSSERAPEGEDTRDAGEELEDDDDDIIELDDVDEDGQRGDIQAASARRRQPMEYHGGDEEDEDDDIEVIDSGADQDSESDGDGGDLEDDDEQEEDEEDEEEEEQEEAMHDVDEDDDDEGDDSNGPPYGRGGIESEESDVMHGMMREGEGEGGAGGGGGETGDADDREAASAPEEADDEGRGEDGAEAAQLGAIGSSSRPSQSGADSGVGGGAGGGVLAGGAIAGAHHQGGARQTPRKPIVYDEEQCSSSNESRPPMQRRSMLNVVNDQLRGGVDPSMPGTSRARRGNQGGRASGGAGNAPGRAIRGSRSGTTLRGNPRGIGRGRKGGAGGKDGHMPM